MNAKNKRNANDLQCTPEGKDIRNKITKIIVWSVVIATGLIAIVAIIVPLLQKDKPNFEFIGQALLPLWATWMGTVIAFYFGKSNFDAATKSYGEIIDKLTPDEKLQKIPINDVMIPLCKVVTMDYENALQKPIRDILNDKKFVPYNRYAFIDDHDKLKAIIHRKNFTQYVTDKLSQGEANPLDILFQDYRKDCEHNKNMKWDVTPVFIALDSNMLNAKNTIFAVPNNRDVFVTQTGKPNESVIGLITDEDILKAINS